MMVDNDSGWQHQLSRGDSGWQRLTTTVNNNGGRWSVDIDGLAKGGEKEEIEDNQGWNCIVDHVISQPQVGVSSSFSRTHIHSGSLSYWITSTLQWWRWTTTMVDIDGSAKGGEKKQIKDTQGWRHPGLELYRGPGPCDFTTTRGGVKEYLALYWSAFSHTHPLPLGKSFVLNHINSSAMTVNNNGEQQWRTTMTVDNNAGQRWCPFDRSLATYN